MSSRCHARKRYGEGWVACQSVARPAEKRGSREISLLIPPTLGRKSAMAVLYCAHMSRNTSRYPGRIESGSVLRKQRFEFFSLQKLNHRGAPCVRAGIPPCRLEILAHHANSNVCPLSACTASSFGKYWREHVRRALEEPNVSSYVPLGGMTPK